jgi:hypothetical protein
VTGALDAALGYAARGWPVSPWATRGNRKFPLSGHGHGRDENTVRERRVELRKVAQTRIAVIEKHARSGLERISSEVQIELLVHGMSETALRLLEQATEGPADADINGAGGRRRA